MPREQRMLDGVAGRRRQKLERFVRYDGEREMDACAVVFGTVGPRRDLEDSTTGRLGKHTHKRGMQCKIRPMQKSEKKRHHDAPMNPVGSVRPIPTRQTMSKTLAKEGNTVNG